jgi:hypothetical protein
MGSDCLDTTARNDFVGLGVLAVNPPLKFFSYVGICSILGATEEEERRKI